MQKGNLLLKPPILLPVIICVKTQYCGGLAWQTGQGGEKRGGKLMGQDKDILAAEGKGQQCKESSLDRGERGKDAQGSTVLSDAWSAKSNRGQTSVHLRPLMARGVDLPCPMLWDTSRVSGLKGPT